MRAQFTVLEAAVARLEGESRRMRQSLAEAQKVAKVGTWEMDLATGAVSWSAEMQRLVGIKPTEEPPALERLMERTHPEDRDRLDAALQRALAGVPTPPLEHRLLLPDGTVHWVNSRLSSIPGSKGGYAAVAGTCQDITEHRLAASAIRQTQHLESLGVLAGGIAHDFAEVALAFEALVDQARANASGNEDLEIVLRSMERTLSKASALTEQIMAYTRAGAGSKAPLDLDAMLLGMVPLLEVAVNVRDNLVMDLQTPLPALDGDEGQLKQVVLALVTNAAEALPDNAGTILVGTGTQILDARRIAREYPDQDLVPGSYVSLDVRDTGCGMPQETLVKVFDPFFTTKQRGRGLGLTAVKGIVAAHGGGIQITSRPGDGTSVRVLLPASNVHLVGADASRTASQVGEGPMVLVADDDPVLLQSASETLMSAGFRVLQAADGVEAVAHYQQHGAAIAMALLDVSMPRMGGKEALAVIRANHPDAKIFLCSGFAETGAYECKPSGFLPKPYRMKDLAAVVAAEVRGA